MATVFSIAATAIAARLMLLLLLLLFCLYTTTMACVCTYIFSRFFFFLFSNFVCLLFTGNACAASLSCIFSASTFFSPVCLKYTCLRVCLCVCVERRSEKNHSPVSTLVRLSPESVTMRYCADAYASVPDAFGPVNTRASAHACVCGLSFAKRSLNYTFTYLKCGCRSFVVLCCCFRYHVLF